jgi:xanthine/uracil permease
MNKKQKQIKMFWYSAFVMVAFSVISAIIVMIFPNLIFVERYLVLVGSIIGIGFYVFLSLYKSD